MMELERNNKMNTSTLTMPNSSAMSESELGSYRINGDQLVELLSNGYSLQCVILDCREHGSLPVRHFLKNQQTIVLDDSQCAQSQIAYCFVPAS